MAKDSVATGTKFGLEKVVFTGMEAGGQPDVIIGLVSYIRSDSTRNNTGGGDRIGRFIELVPGIIGIAGIIAAGEQIPWWTICV